MRFHDISVALLRGETFFMLANEHNIPLADLDDVHKNDQFANSLGLRDHRAVCVPR